MQNSVQGWAPKINNAGYQNNVQAANAPSAPVQDSPDKSKQTAKAIAIASVAALAIGTAAIAMKKSGGIKKAQALFDDLIKNAKKGNNDILSDAIKKQDDAVSAFAKEHPKGWQATKDRILSLIDIKDADDVLAGENIYHGTKVKSAKSMLEQGATPFSVKRPGSGSGMGHGIYATPDLKAAEFYSEGGMVLPYKLKGKVAVLKEGVSPEDIKLGTMSEVMTALDPPPMDEGIFANLLHTPNAETRAFAADNQSQIVTRAMQELGVDAIYTKGATSRGGLMGSALNNAPEFLDDAAQVAVFNGGALHLDPEKLRQLNPVTGKNYRSILEALAQK